MNLPPPPLVVTPAIKSGRSGDQRSQVGVNRLALAAGLGSGGGQQGWGDIEEFGSHINDR